MDRRRMFALAAMVVSVATAVRVVIAASGWFYWDDLILTSIAAGHQYPDAGLLLRNHDGHLMPGGMALAWLAAHTAPLQWWMPLVQLAVLNLLALGALARLLWVLLPGRPAFLLVLAAAAVLPLGLPAATWWASGLNALPLATALSWSAASTVKLAHTGRVRHAVGAVLATAFGLLFVEKAVLVPLFAAAVLAGCWWIARRGDRAMPIRQLWGRTRWMWLGQAVVLAAWSVVYSQVVGFPRPASDAAGIATAAGAATGTGITTGTEIATGQGGSASLFAFADHAYRLAIVPALAGGPWRWERWHPGPPWADPPVFAIVLGALSCAVVLAISLLTRRGTAPIWLGAAAYPLLSVVAIAAVRQGPDTAAEIVQTLRYHSDAVVVFAAAAALALAAPARRLPQWAPRISTGVVRAATALALCVYLVSSTVSTAAYRSSWGEQPSRDYLVPLLAALRERQTPILDQDVPPEVLLPVTRPANRLSALLRGVSGIPQIGEWTTEPTLIDAEGRLLPADIVQLRALDPGPEPGCGTRIGPQPTRINLDGPLMDRDWMVRLNYFAPESGTVTARLDTGGEVTVPVEPGLGSIVVRLIGSGSALTASYLPSGPSAEQLCLGSGPVGVLVVR